MAESVRRGGWEPRVRVTALVAGVAAGIAMLGCHDAASPVGQSGAVEPEPQAGRYVVAEFDFRNACADPVLGLSTRAATDQSATIDLERESDQLGSLVLTGGLQIDHPAPGEADAVIFAGPDSGLYGIVNDTLQLWFPKTVNQWVGVLRFTQYQGGQLVGTYRGRCRSLFLRLERRP